MPAQDSWGGPAACEPPFVEALIRRGERVNTATYVFGDKASSTGMIGRVMRVLKTAVRFRRLLKQHRPDVLHLNTAFDLKTLLRDSVTLAFAGRGPKVFLKLHGSTADAFQNSGIFVRALIDFIERRTVGFGCLSREEIESFKRLGFDEDKLYLVGNAVESEPGSERGAKLEVDTFEIVFASRFVRAKGLLETIQACELLRARGIKFRLTCVGDGEVMQEAKDLVGRFALGRIVTFTGYVSESEVSRYLAGSDVLVFPTSHPEGFPMVLFKAMAAGLPIVTTRIRAAADRLSEPENCLFCIRDPENIADRLEELANDDQLRSEMSARNIVAALAFTPDAIAAQYVEIYEKLRSP